MFAVIFFHRASEKLTRIRNINNNNNTAVGVSFKKYLLKSAIHLSPSSNSSSAAIDAPTLAYICFMVDSVNSKRIFCRYSVVLQWCKILGYDRLCNRSSHSGSRRWRIDAWFTTGRMSRVLHQRKLTTQRVIGRCCSSRKATDIAYVSMWVSGIFRYEFPWLTLVAWKWNPACLISNKAVMENSSWSMIIIEQSVVKFASLFVPWNDSIGYQCCKLVFRLLSVHFARGQ